MEVLALLPLVVMAAVLAWQLAAVAGAALQAEEEARRGAMAASAARGATVATATVVAPSVIPGLAPMRVVAQVPIVGGGDQRQGVDR